MFAAAVGITTRVFGAAWRYFWSIETGRWENGWIIGGCMGLFIFFSGLGFSLRWSWISAGILIAGSFIGKLIQKYFEE